MNIHIKEMIEKLNADTAALVAQGVGVYDALKQAAFDNGFKHLFENGDVEIWQNQAGELVNVWTGNDEIGHGLDGFDDQVEWYTDAEAPEVDLPL